MSEYFVQSFKEAIELFQYYEIDMDKIVGLTDYKEQTIKQNITKSTPPPKKFQDKFIKAVNEIINDCYDFFKIKNQVKTKYIDLTLYDNSFPKIPYSQFSWNPRIYETHGAAESADEKNINYTSWSSWKTDLWHEVIDYNFNDPAVDSHIKKLLGYPGSGKSTILSMLLLAAYNDKIDINGNNIHVIEKILPIFVSLNFYHVNKNIESIIDAAISYYQDYWDNNKGIKLKKFLEKNKKKILFLLDGFDEVPPKIRIDISKQISCSNHHIIVTSRHTLPDYGRFNGKNFFIGYLTEDDVIAHIQLIIDTLSNDDSRDLLDNLKSTIQRKFTNPIIGFDEYVNPKNPTNIIAETPERSFEKCETINKKRDNLTKEELKIISSPILLNLLIAYFLREKILVNVIPNLITTYVKFLIGNWQKSRQSDPNICIGSNDSGIIRDLNQALQLTAFMLLTYEHCIGQKISKEKVEYFLKNYLFNNRKNINELIIEFFDRATSAKLLSLENDNQICEFAYPHEYLRDLYSSMFIEYSGYLGLSFSDTASKHPSKFATCSAFLNNPNLRFLESAIVYFLIRKSTDSETPTQHLERIFEAFITTPAINTLFCGLDAEQVNKIIPLNIILLGRVFNGNNYLMELFPKIADELSCKIKDLYLNTNIEFIYQVLRNIYYNFDCNNCNNNPDDLEHKWRIANNCEELAAINRIIDDIKDDIKKDIIERRIVYQYRYHADTFNEYSYNFLALYLNRFESEKITDQSRRLLAFNTLRIIRDNMIRHQKCDSTITLFIQLDLIVKENEEKIKKFKIDATELMQPVIDHAFERPDEFINAFYQVRFSVKKIFPAQFISALNKPHTDKAKFERFISIVISRLKEAQEKGVALIENYENSLEKDELDKNIEIQASLVLLLTYMADTFSGKQFMMPEEFNLNDITDNDIGDLSYDSTEVLKLLFNGAKEGLNDGKVSLDVGGWQLYDIYVQAIWRILHYLPLNAHYEYLY